MEDGSAAERDMRRDRSPDADGRRPAGEGDAELRSVERERDDAEASRDQFSFLAEASRCLADSLDYEATLTTVAGMSLPYLDAWCIVDVVTEVGGIRRIAVLHPDPAKQEIARALYTRYGPRPGDLIGAPRVMESGRPELVFDVPDAALVASARDEEHLALLRALGLRSYVVAPMLARGRMLGAMTFVTAEAGRRFGTIDVVMAEELARRAATAVDNARLHAEAVQARDLAEEALEEAEQATESLREARDLAEAALRVRSEFLATMTHEVRTPLNAVVGYLQLLELELAGGLTETQRGYVERARDSTRHLLRLVEDVLDLAKSESAPLDVARDVVSAEETARAAVAVLRPQAGGKLVQLEDRVAGAGALAFVGDDNRARQILINLLANAIKFTPAGGRVTLDAVLEPAAAEGGPWVRFVVRDTGQGVAPAEAESIFEPFVQGQAGLTRAFGGTGLGLSISRRLARLMGGDVLLDDSGGDVAGDAGAGATFALRLPAADAPAPGATAGPYRAAPAERAPGRREAARRGIAAAAEALLRANAPTVEAFVRRARADATLEVPDAMTDVEVADHLGTLLTDLANSLALLGESGGQITERMTDGSRIQRLIGELHGAQRHRLGWSEQQLAREAELVRQVCQEAIERAVATDEAAATAASQALALLLQERTRATRSGYRAAAAAGGP